MMAFTSPLVPRRAPRTKRDERRFRRSSPPAHLSMVRHHTWVGRKGQLNPVRSLALHHVVAHAAVALGALAAGLARAEEAAAAAAGAAGGRAAAAAARTRATRAGAGNET